jgi:integrase
MPRRPKPWYKQSHNAWYVKIKGKALRLGETEAEAWAEFHRLMASMGRPTGKIRPTGRPTVGTILNAWMESRKKEVNERSFEISRFFAQSFLDHMPADAKAEDVDEEVIKAWLAANPQWTRSTPGLAARMVKSALGWAVSKGWFERSLLATMKIPAANVRGEADPEYARRVIAETSKGARDILLFLAATGARPGEAMGVKVEDVNLAARVVHVVGKMGPRLVILPAEYVPAVREMMEARGTGHLFRTAAGTPWSQPSLLSQVMRAKKKIGERKPFSPYHLRGMFATARIEAGVDVSTVGKLLGHSGISTLYKHYYKPSLDSLREAVDEDGETKKPRQGRGVD